MINSLAGLKRSPQSILGVMAFRSLPHQVPVLRVLVPAIRGSTSPLELTLAARFDIPLQSMGCMG